MINKWYILIGIILLLSLSGCQSELSDEEVASITIEDDLRVYLLNSSRDALVEVNIQVDKTNIPSQVDDVLKVLIIGDSNNDLHGTIPLEDMVEGYELLEDGLRIYVTDAFSLMNQVTYLICRSSIVKSVASIEGISYVEFYEDRLPMKDDFGKVYGAFYPDDIITVSNTANTLTQVKTVLLYYPDQQGEFLEKVEREIALSSGESIEKRLVEELMLPEIGYTSPLPEGTTVKNINVTSGICYVDLNEAFRTNHYGGSTGEVMTVYSIVNTLTELPDVSRVQFLIEGEKTDFFKGHLDFSELFEFNIELISQQSSLNR